MTELCENCTFFKKLGWCARYPPHPISSDPKCSVFPITAHDQWCGEWKPAQQDVQKDVKEDAKKPMRRASGPLYERRRAAGLTQEKLGELAGISGDGIGHIERGGGTRTSTLQRIADALDCSVKDLLP